MQKPLHFAFLALILETQSKRGAGYFPAEMRRSEAAAPEEPDTDNAGVGM